MENKYDNIFFESMTKNARDSAQIIVPIIMELFNPKSVVDLGTGTGSWLKEFKKQGVNNVVGYDGDYVNLNQLEINLDEFKNLDLNSDYTLKGKYDLAMSLEVAEHLDPNAAINLIGTLTKLSDIVMFSAALPYQGGTEHVNEMPISFWVSEFEKYSYDLYDIIRPQIWEDKRVLSCYRQNVVIFVKKNLQINTKKDIVSIKDIVHPEMLEYRLSRYDAFLNVLLNNREYHTLIQSLNYMIENVKDLHKEELYYLARAYKEINQYDLAIVKFNEYINYSNLKYLVSAYFHLGETYYLCGLLEESKKCFEKCEELTNLQHNKAKEFLNNLKNKGEN